MGIASLNAILRRCSFYHTEATASPQRRQLLRTALERRLGKRMKFAELPGGLHLIGRIDGDDKAIAARAREAGLGLQALNNWCVEARQEPALVMSFTNVKDERQATELARRVAQVMET